MTKFSKHFLSVTIFLAITNCLYSQLSSLRKRELDSIVSFIPKSKLTNLDSVHRFIHINGYSDEERVWMFYGYLGVYFSYDWERFGDMHAPSFSPEYTAQRKKGVCRDYARVFSYLCDKSKIPNFVVSGKVKEKLLTICKKVLHQYKIYPNHQWNIVFYNQSWHLMDPTWSNIETSEKSRFWNNKSKHFEFYHIKRSSRKYYDASPEFMASTHVPIYPAFFLLNQIPTFKSALKKKQKIYHASYDYKSNLDSIQKFSYPIFTSFYNDEAVKYTGYSELNNEFFYLLSETNWKTARYFKPTLDYYDNRIENLKQVITYIQNHANKDYSAYFENYRKDMLRKKEKLRLKGEKTKK